MPEAVVSAIYGSCAGSKCADLTAGNFWEHCVKADEIFVQVRKAVVVAVVVVVIVFLIVIVVFIVIVVVAFINSRENKSGLKNVPKS